MSAGPIMSAAEFVNMTMAFADDMARKHSEAQQGASWAPYNEARADFCRHLHDSYRGIEFYFYAEGLKDKRLKSKGDN